MLSGEKNNSPRIRKQEVGFSLSDSNEPVSFTLFSLEKKDVPQSEATVIYEDHLACRQSYWSAMSVKRVRRKYSRHMDIRRHYMREVCVGGSVKVVARRGFRVEVRWSSSSTHPSYVRAATELQQSCNSVCVLAL